MFRQEEAKKSAVIYAFPARSRIVANRIAEQVRRMKQIESAGALPVVDAGAWYHEAAVAEQKRRG